MPQQPLDQDAKRLALAIRNRESGGNYQARGASGEYGAYQFMPDTWKGSAKKYLGAENAPLTAENQNKVAYSQIKEWKDQGYKPDQIASMWNSGRPDAHKTGGKGVNKMGVAYDVPAYVEGVKQEYQKLAGTQPQQTPQNDGGLINTAYADEGNVPPVVEQPKSLSQKIGGIADTIFGGGKIGEAIGTQIAKGNLGSWLQKKVIGQDLAPEVEAQVENGPTARQVVGDVARVATNFAPVGRVGGAITNRLTQEGVKRFARPLGTVASTALEGGAIGLTEAARQGTDLSEGTMTGAKFGAGIGVAGAGAMAGLRKIGNTSGASRLEDLAGNLVTPSKIIREQTRRGRSPLDVIKEEGVMPEVINSKTDTTKMVEALESRLEEAATLTRETLKNSNLVVPFAKFKKDVAKAIVEDETIRNLGQTDIALRQVAKILKSYKGSYGDKIPVTVIDDIRQTMNQNKWKQETHDIYRAIGDATRKIVYDAVPDQQVKTMLQREGELIGARDLAKSLNAKAVKNGLLGKHFEGILGGMVGAGVGSMTGPLGIGAGALVGNLAARKVGDIARSAYFKTPVANKARQIVNAIESTPLTPGDRLLQTEAGQKLENKLKESVETGGAGLSMRRQKIEQDDLNVFSDFTDFVAGDMKLDKKQADALRTTVFDIAERYGLQVPKTDRGLSNLLGRVLEKEGFKRGFKEGVTPNKLTNKLADPLIQEAKKYKSAEEFVKGQTPIFRGRESAPATNRMREGATPEYTGTAFSRQREQAQKYGDLMLAKYIPESKVLKSEDISQSTLRQLRKEFNNLLAEDADSVPIEKLITKVMNLAKQNNKGAADIASIFPQMGEEAEIRLLGKEADALTKSQLVGIWKKANGK